MQMPYLSPSRLSLFAQCELAFKFKYIETPTWEDETTDWYGSFGTLMHGIYEKLAQNKIQAWEAHILYDKEFPYCYIPDKQRPDYYSAGKASIDQLATELKTLNIIGVEKEFTTMLDFSIPPLHGFIDLIYEDEIGLVVRDYKTSKVYDKTTMSKQIQPIAYAVACKALYGKYPYKFEFHFSRFNTIKSVLIDENFIKLGEIKIKNYWNKIQTSQFPASFSPFFCKSFCQHRGICPTYQMKVNY